MTFTFHDTPVYVGEAQKLYVVTAPEGDCISILRDVEKFEKQLARGIWEDAYVYRLSEDRGVEVVQQPTGVQS